MTTSNKNHETRKVRQKQTAEVFTPPKLVRQMLNKLPKEVWRKGKTFCDPAVGNGNFLIAILIRKIEKDHNPLQAIQSIYGVDIMRDNIQECRLRLLKVLQLFSIPITEDSIRAVMTNIVWININKYPGGSLEYDFEFKSKPKQADIDRWMEWVHKGHALDSVELPVEEETFNSSGVPQIDWEA